MGAITPLGHTVQSLWGAIVAGQSGAGFITLFDHSQIDVHIAA